MSVKEALIFGAVPEREIVSMSITHNGGSKDAASSLVGNLR